MGLTKFPSRHPVASYFAIVFTISWTLAFLVVSPEILRGQPIPYSHGVIMFPAMLAGPSIGGLLLTRIVDGKTGLKELFARMRNWRVGRWVLPLLVPPALILLTLLTLTLIVSPEFMPHIFVFGFGFGLMAGYVEEIGWTGYAIRKLGARYGMLGSALVLGMFWGLWHAPVVDFLGAAYPHGAFWLPFYLSFIAIVMAVRVLIVTLYSNTESVLIAQVMHASSTGFLATLAPSPLLPAQEAGWYAAYAGLLWIVVSLVASRYGKQMTGRGL
ncbi:CPBP family intramembrane metalloprotease [Candidatus Bathyarchaeota archaeon]|nr:CPBP family intramembrane metalloprotease [Candidatus Bathyarchaeota archaeon]